MAEKLYTETEVIELQREAYRTGAADMYYDDAVSGSTEVVDLYCTLRDRKVLTRYPMPVVPTVVREGEDTTGYYEFRIFEGKSQWRWVSKVAGPGEWAQFYLTPENMAILANNPTTEA